MAKHLKVQNVIVTVIDIVGVLVSFWQNKETKLSHFYLSIYIYIKNPNLCHFTNVVVSLYTAVNVPVVLVSFPECTTVPVSAGVVHWLLSVPIKLMTPLVAEAPVPSVFVRIQTVVQTHPRTAFNCQRNKLVVTHTTAY